MFEFSSWIHCYFKKRSISSLVTGIVFFFQKSVFSKNSIKFYENIQENFRWAPLSSVDLRRALSSSHDLRPAWPRFPECPRDLMGSTDRRCAPPNSSELWRALPSSPKIYQVPSILLRCSVIWHAYRTLITDFIRCHGLPRGFAIFLPWWGLILIRTFYENVAFVEKSFCNERVKLKGRVTKT